MAIVVSTIESVEQKDTSRGDVWEATLADGTKVATFDEDIAAQLEEHEGGDPVRLDIETTTRGKYTNHYVNGVELAPEGSTTKKPKRGGARKKETGKAAPAGLPDPTGERIARTSALKLALDKAIAETDEGDEVEIDFDYAFDVLVPAILEGTRP